MVYNYSGSLMDRDFNDLEALALLVGHRLLTDKGVNEAI